MPQKPLAPSLAEIPGFPKDTEGPVFGEPWQAQIFALVLSLYESGKFTWQEWADTLSQKIKQIEDTRSSFKSADYNELYFQAWLAALEEILIAKNVLQEQEMASMKSRWKQAYETTPHGLPVKL